MKKARQDRRRRPLDALGVSWHIVRWQMRERGLPHVAALDRRTAFEPLRVKVLAQAAETAGARFEHFNRMMRHSVSTSAIREVSLEEVEAHSGLEDRQSIKMREICTTICCTL